MAISVSVIESPQAVEVNEGLPAGWDERRLGDFADIRRGASPRPIASPRWFSEDSNIGWVRISDIKVGTKYLDATRQKLSPDGVLRSRYLTPGHLIMSIAATVGRPAITRIPACIHDGFIAFMDLREIEIDFLYYLILHLEAELADAGQTGSQSNINTQIVHNLLVRVPRKPEQKAIAEALSEVDELIVWLDRLIAKKQDIKRAAMQQLLSGKTRLPGFSSEWQEIHRGSHVVFLNTTSNSRAELSSNGQVKYLHYGDIHTSIQIKLDASLEVMPRLDVVRARAADRLQVGDLVLVDASEDTVGLGKSVEIVGVPMTGVIAGLHTIAARFDKAVLADGFKGYLQFHPEFRAALLRLAAGTKVLATSKNHIASIDMKLPDIEEQHAIARVLTDMDTEIHVLKQRRDKSKAIKQGMMQELLTGRTRLQTQGGAR